MSVALVVRSTRPWRPFFIFLPFSANYERVISIEPIIINNLTFAYPGQTPLFKHCDLNFNSDWKLGLLGRNGRGKTTLFKLLQGQLAYQGQIQTNLHFGYYPFQIIDNHDLVWNNLTEIAPQVEQWQVERELNLMATDSALLWQPFETLSGGEQTRVMLATLFAQPELFPLLDEPTNHLDQKGRQLIARYLKNKKTGFIITSHDQKFLDQIIDHTLVIEQHQIVLEHGNYSDYFAKKQLRDNEAITTNEQLLKDIHHLKQVQTTKKQWAQRAENEKNNNSHADKGFLGAKAAKMMKKSVIINNRLNQTIQERQGLLQDVEKIVPLAINVRPTHDQELLRVTNLSLSYPEHPLFTGLSFTVNAHDQVLICGDNGKGKSSLFQAICNDFTGLQAGKIAMSKTLKISLVRQNYHGNCGTLQEFAKRAHLDYSTFLNLLRKLGMERETFTTPVEQMSMGQQKKVELARSLAEPAQFYLWDEPLNYLDTYNQEQIINLIHDVHPPMLIIEHDQHFIDQVATQRLNL